MKGSPEDPRFDSKENWKSYVGSQSRVFTPGERIRDTLLTVVGPAFKDQYGKITWREIEVLCDPQYGGCGKHVVFNYAAVYQYLGKYSCGCRSRRRWNEHEYDGFTVTGYLTGRVLTILYYDYEASAWLYVCECCGDTGHVPRGQGATVSKKIKAIARETRPNKPRYYSVEQLPDVRRSTFAIAKTTVDANLKIELEGKYPGCKVIYGGNEGRLIGIETRLPLNPPLPKPAARVESTQAQAPLPLHSDFSLDGDLEEL